MKPVRAMRADTPGGAAPHQWSLQRKAWLITTGVLAGLAVFLAIGVDGVFRKGSSELESQWIAESVRRVQALQAAEVEGLVRSARDYASWTDTYNFMADTSTPYLENNLTASMFGNLQIDAFLLFRGDGRLRAGRTFVDGEVGEAGVGDLAGALAAYARRVAADGATRKGVVAVSDGVALFAALPILRDDETGPSGGALVQVRYLHAARVNRLRETLNLALTLHEVANAPADRDLPHPPDVAAGADFGALNAGERRVVVHVPVRNNEGEPVAMWHLDLPREIHLQGVRARLVFYVVMAVLVMAAAGLIGWLLRSMVIARLEALHVAVQQVGEHTDLSMRLPLNGSDEITGLASGINGMLEALAEGEAQRAAAEKERAHLNAQLQHAQKMEVLGTLTGGLAHDFNNLLTSVLGSLTLIRLEGTPAPSVEAHLRRIEQAATQAVAIVKQMMAFGRRTPAVFASVRLGTVVKDSLQLLRPSIPRGVQFDFQNEAADDVVNGDAGQLQQVLVNLGTNASHAMAGGTGRLTVRICDVSLPDAARPETAAVAPGAFLRLTFADTGCGIAPEDRSRVFEPFFTTKPVGSGTGLGLAVVHGIVIQHHGTIGVQSEPGQGTTFYIHLPKAAPAGALVAEPAPRAAGSRASLALAGRLLLVDDDDMVRETLAAGMRRLGYEVTPVSGGREALEWLRTGMDRIDFLVTDQMMPGLTGTELGQTVVARHPAFPLILMTGYASALNEAKVKAMGFSAMLMKPVTMEELDRTLQAVRAAARS